MAPRRIRSGIDSIVGSLGDRGWFYYRRARVVRCDAPDADAGDPESDVDVQEASEEDLRHFASMQNRTPAEWLARRAQGTICLLARRGPTRLGYLWITRSAELMIEVNHVVDVSRDAAGAYMFDGYVAPEHRRQGVLRELLRSSKRWAVQHDISRLYAAFARENRVSEHALHAAGFTTVVGDIGILRLAHREWKWVRLPHDTSMINVLGVERASRTRPRPT